MKKKETRSYNRQVFWTTPLNKGTTFLLQLHHIDSACIFYVMTFGVRWKRWWNEGRAVCFEVCVLSQRKPVVCINALWWCQLWGLCSHCCCAFRCLKCRTWSCGSTTCVTFKSSVRTFAGASHVPTRLGQHRRIMGFRQWCLWGQETLTLSDNEMKISHKHSPPTMNNDESLMLTLPQGWRQWREGRAQPLTLTCHHVF